MTKRIVVVSDIHCGHIFGLLHPMFRGMLQKEYQEVSEKLWDYFAKEVDAIRPVDILVCNGDAVHGRAGGFWGTRQIFTDDRFQQANIAAECLRYVGAKSVLMTYGTACHVGDGAEDWESLVAEKLNASIDAQIEMKVNGTTFHFKHHIQGSGVPQGRYTAIAREGVWNLLWSEHGERSKAQVVVRSHVHSYSMARSHGWMGLTTPALMSWMNKHGQRNLSSTVDFGFLHFDVREDPGDYDLHEHIIHGLQKAEIKVF